ncbi:MAG: primase [Clostridiales bacterium]|nr:primase [Clostridiales bacterium]
MGEFFDREWVDEVRSRNDIVDVIGEYLKLKPSGRNFMALCPFHNEKTPSFSVSPDKQIYHCFGCGAGGNVIGFIMAMERVDFTEAVKLLAKRAGIPIPESYMRGAIADAREAIYRLNTEAARYFHRCLRSDEGKAAREYLMRRGIEAKTIVKFGLGFAPAKWDGLKQHLLSLGYDQKHMLDSGLIVASKAGDQSYDRFRNRVMFPIFDVRKRIIGFGGRVLDDSLPKYLNSPDTALFHKGQNLYALDIVAKARDLECIIVVEGYMDAVMLHQYGVDNAVASLGTALTEEQAKLMKRYAQKIIICYDGDIAGKKAATRGLDILLNQGLDVYVLTLPDGVDPDEFVRKYGKDAFLRSVRSAKPWLDYSMGVLASRYDISTTNGKTSFAKEAVKLLGGINDPIQKDLYLKGIERYSGVSLEILYGYMNKRKTARISKEGQGIAHKISAVQKAEQELLNIMANQPEMAAIIMQRITADDFENELHKKIFDIMSERYKKGEKPSPADVFSYFLGEKAEKSVLSIFTNEPRYDNINKFAAQCINTIKRNKIAMKRQFLCKKADDLASVGDQEALNILLEQINALDKELLDLKELP